MATWELAAISPARKKLALVLAVIGVVCLGIGLYYAYFAPKPAVVVTPTVKSLVITATCEIGTFTEDTTIKVDVYDSRNVLVATATLSPPTYTAEITDISIQGTFYVVATVTSSAKYYWLLSNPAYVATLGWVEQYQAVSESMTIQLRFAKVGDIYFVKAKNATMSLGTVEMVSLVYQFNMTPNSMIRDVSVDVTVSGIETYTLQAIYLNEYSLLNGTIDIANPTDDWYIMYVVVVMQVDASALTTATTVQVNATITGDLIDPVTGTAYIIIS